MLSVCWHIRNRCGKKLPTVQLVRRIRLRSVASCDVFVERYIEWSCIRSWFEIYGLMLMLAFLADHKAEYTFSLYWIPSMDEWGSIMNTKNISIPLRIYKWSILHPFDLFAQTAKKKFNHKFLSLARASIPNLANAQAHNKPAASLINLYPPPAKTRFPFFLCPSASNLPKKNNTRLKWRLHIKSHISKYASPSGICRPFHTDLDDTNALPRTWVRKLKFSTSLRLPDMIDYFSSAMHIKYMYKTRYFIWPTHIFSTQFRYDLPTKNKHKFLSIDRLPRGRLSIPKL